ncbi:MAG: hypothetical protein WKG06_42130 [Segetibacter sp.]
MNNLIKNVKFFSVCVLIQFAVFTVHAQKQQNKVLANDVTISLSTENLHDLLLKQQNPGNTRLKQAEAILT